MRLKNLWDGVLSFCAAMATAVVCGGPSWFTFQAIEAGVAPQWALASVVMLAGFGLLLTVAFLRKARWGISPTREKPRK